MQHLQPAVLVKDGGGVLAVAGAPHDGVHLLPAPVPQLHCPPRYSVPQKHLVSHSFIFIDRQHDLSMAATRSMFPEKKSLMGAAPRSALTSTLAAVVDSSAAISAPERLHRTRRVDTEIRGDMWSYGDIM